MRKVIHNEYHRLHSSGLFLIDRFDIVLRHYTIAILLVQSYAYLIIF